jgi:Domain of unknown function (DUF4115)
MLSFAPHGSRGSESVDRTQAVDLPGEPGTDEALGSARNEADAIRAKAELDAARILRDAEKRAELLVKERLAYAEREVERLRSLRRNIGTLLESSVSALRVVEHLLPHDRAAGVSEPPSVIDRVRLLLTIRNTHRTTTMFAGGIVMAAAVVTAAWFSVRPQSEPAPTPAETASRPADALDAAPGVHQAADIAVAPQSPAVSPAATSGNLPTPSDLAKTETETPALTVVLLAERQCWIRATVDGNRITERLLEPAQELVLRARESVLLRVGDAGALLATINGKRAAPFGRPGEVITRQITLQNYSRWVGVS